MVSFYYESSTGEIIDLRQFHARILKADINKYSWEPIGVERNYGKNITDFKKQAVNYELQIMLRGLNVNRRARLNRFTDITEQGIIEKKPGKLHFGDWYIECFCISSNTATESNTTATFRTWGLYAPYPFWIKEESKEFYPHAPSEGEYLDYNYDYGYDYSFDENGVAVWDIAHYAPSDFIMTIYGYAEEPHILINGHEYIVYTTLDSNDYLQINTREMTVIKYLSSGEQINVFDLRGKANNIFKKIDGGQNIITWNGSFGFDITAFIERSEPRW